MLFWRLNPHSAAMLETGITSATSAKFLKSVLNECPQLLFVPGNECPLLPPSRGHPRFIVWEKLSLFGWHSVSHAELKTQSMMQWVRLLTSSPCELQCPSLFTQSSPPAVHTPHPTRSLQPFSAGVTPGVKQATDRQGCGLSGGEGAVVWIIYKLLCSKSALMKQFFGWSS